MLTKNEIIGNVLLKELIEIRTDTLWRMLALLFPDGVVNNVNLDTGFFTRTTRIVYTAKAAVHKRNRRVNSTLDNDIDAKDIIRSHSPPYVAPPYGSRTRISTCVSVGLIDPNIYFAYCKRECNLSEERLRLFAEYGGVKALCILRTYEPTNPGKRSLKYRMDLIAPQKDVGLDLDRIGRQARKRYRIKAVRPS